MLEKLERGWGRRKGRGRKISGSGRGGGRGTGRGQEKGEEMKGNRMRERRNRPEGHRALWPAERVPGQRGESGHQ